ncbi:hypothetical protein [Pseudoduganella lutea]|uniref:Uncharacterized protein n=1 Tax=Pseudoduganella lutea TaxID=321985 RepID=A0A4P6L5D8_9BURK|nr:hypothetical protein [Pseudoduganella lutea]QBE66849.1 hypothetical protein EWM63_30975 [Pseudoduganella lutea]
MFNNTKLKEVLHRTYLAPYKLQSDYARDNAQEVAALASMGYITTYELPRQFGNKWRITGIGLEKLRKLGAL